MDKFFEWSGDKIKREKSERMCYYSIKDKGGGLA